MNLSNSVIQQIERLSLQGSFSMNMNQKRELARFNKENGLRELVNFECNTCVRDAMYAAKRFIEQHKKTPRLHKDKMVKNPKDMKRPELMKACKDKGISFGRSATKKELIQLLNGNIQ